MGNIVKLRGLPKASTTKRIPERGRGRVKNVGYGKTVEDATMVNPQPSPKGLRPTDAVHRLDGGGHPGYGPGVLKV